MEHVQAAVQDTSTDPFAPAAELGRRLRARGLQIAVAESCTGGLIAYRITGVAGSSDYFVGGVVAYANQVKERVLGVRAETLESFGAVSRECALEMAAGVREAFGSDIGIASTGIAGPGGATARKPVGLVYVAASTPTGDDVRELRLEGDRLSVMDASSAAALELALLHLPTQES